MVSDSSDSKTPSGSSVQRPNLARRRGEDLVIGRLVAYGRAHYQFRIEEDPSYFVKLLTSAGPRTLWGKDLERALREADTRPQAGDLVGARRQAREAVTVTERIRDAQGSVILTSERLAHRSLWQVEKVTFFAERARLARRVREDQNYDKATIKQHPELRSSFLSVRAAEEFAKSKIPNAEDQKKFLELIRGVLAGSIREGAPLPNLRLKDRGSPARSNSTLKKPDEPTR